jgi:hypothetical protein
MAKNIDKLAKSLGADVKGQLPDTGGGAFGMLRVAEFLAARLEPAKGKRPGRPSNPAWVYYRKIPMSVETFKRLTALAKSSSTDKRRISPMQLAAQLLEDSLARLSNEKGGR